MSNEIIIKRFLDIKDCIEIILDRTSNLKSHMDFVNDDEAIEKFDSVMMRLQVIGELLKNIDKKIPDFLKTYSEINWKQAVGLRNIISH